MYKPLATFTINVFVSLLCFFSILSSRQIETFYGPLEVHEPVLLELIDSPIFQRLKKIHQYGVSYYTTHREEYNRYDHSIGVFTILRKNQASLEEQIAGLLHDVSHTVFSHVGDWIFNKENQAIDYQNSIHSLFIQRSGLGDILSKYNYSIDDLLPKNELFPALENSLPNLCADRIDYNIQGAYYQGFISYDEAMLIFNDLQFVDNRWISTSPDLMRKLTLFSLFMTQDCWGSPTNYVTSKWLAEAILRGIDLGDITYFELHYGTDQAMWDKLISQKDVLIEKKMQMVLNSQEYYSVVDYGEEADFVVRSKFRGIDPLIIFDSECMRMTEFDEELGIEFKRVRKVVQDGWPIKFH